MATDDDRERDRPTPHAASRDGAGGASALRSPGGADHGRGADQGREPAVEPPSTGEAWPTGSGFSGPLQDRWPEDQPLSAAGNGSEGDDDWPDPVGTAGWGATPEPPVASRGPNRTLLALIGLAVLAFVLVGLLLLRGGEQAGTRGVQDLGVGDCLTDPLAGQTEAEVDRVQAVACDQSHDAEVYAAFDLPETAGVEFPGEDTVTGLAEAGCLERFEGYVGIPFADSVLRFSTISPTAASWETGDREVLCVASNVSGEPLTGSVEGSEQ